MDSKIQSYIDNLTFFDNINNRGVGGVVLILSLFALVLCMVILIVLISSFILKLLLTKYPSELTAKLFTGARGLSSDVGERKIEIRGFIVALGIMTLLSLVLICSSGGIYKALEGVDEEYGIRIELINTLSNSEGAEVLKLDDFLTDRIIQDRIGVTSFSYDGRDYINKGVLYLDSSLFGEDYTGNTGLIKPDTSILSELETEFLTDYAYFTFGQRRANLEDIDFIYIIKQAEEKK